MVSRGDILMLGISAGVSGSLVGGLMVFAGMLILVGLQLLALGLLGELQVWQYFNPSARKPYSVSEVVDVRAAMAAD